MAYTPSDKSHLISAYICCIMAFMILSPMGCQEASVTEIKPWSIYDESEMLASVQDHEVPRMRYKLIQSKVSDPNTVWDDVRDDLLTFSEEDYLRLYPLIYEKGILDIQESIHNRDLNYEELTKWYLYRIVKFENDSTTTLHSIISLNADAVEEARMRDQSSKPATHPIFGMPILLKDNINTEGMNTTAGAIALKDNKTGDAHIVKNLKEKGAIILGKVNLSEWAYFFCGGCPVGYSAIGGQTLNPYGRGKFETGGSSAGSGTSVAANYAVGAVGTETSGSILSPSSKNSVVGLKPTIGLLSRSGIVPISSTLDTPGPMTKSVTDNAIILDAMAGSDEKDSATDGMNRSVDLLASRSPEYLVGKRLGVITRFLEADSIYKSTVNRLRELGVVLVEYEAPQVRLEGFGVLLSADMNRDLPKYLNEYGGENVGIQTVEDVVVFNSKDTTIRAPYGQARLEGSASDSTADDQLASLSKMLEVRGRKYFDEAFQEYDLDAILSIDNYSAGFAAVAKYPCLTIPMGYKKNGEPTNLTFIGPSQSEAELLKLGFSFEQQTKVRKAPF